MHKSEVCLVESKGTEAEADPVESLVLIDALSPEGLPMSLKVVVDIPLALSIVATVVVVAALVNDVEVP